MVMVRWIWEVNFTPSCPKSPIDSYPNRISVNIEEIHHKSYPLPPPFTAGCFGVVFMPTQCFPFMLADRVPDQGQIRETNSSHQNKVTPPLFISSGLTVFFFLLISTSLCSISGYWIPCWWELTGRTRFALGCECKRDLIRHRTLLGGGAVDKMGGSFERCSGVFSFVNRISTHVSRCIGSFSLILRVFVQTCRRDSDLLCRVCKPTRQTMKVKSFGQDTKCRKLNQYKTHRGVSHVFPAKSLLKHT